MDAIALQYKRIRRKYPDAPELEIWHGVAMDFYLRHGTIPTEVLVQSALARAEGYGYKYRPDQLRVPAGNPDGGQWTDEGGDGGGRVLLDDNGEVPTNAGREVENNEPSVIPASLRDRLRSAMRVARQLGDRLTRKPSQVDNLSGRSTEHDPLTPEGKKIGVRGSSTQIRNVSPDEYKKLKSDLLRDSKDLPSRSDYNGKVYERPDGTQFGIRNNERNQETIDVFKSPNPLLKNGMKVHQYGPES